MPPGNWCSWVYRLLFVSVTCNTRVSYNVYTKCTSTKYILRIRIYILFCYMYSSTRFLHVHAVHDRLFLLLYLCLVRILRMSFGSACAQRMKFKGPGMHGEDVFIPAKTISQTPWKVSRKQGFVMLEFQARLSQLSFGLIGFSCVNFCPTHLQILVVNQLS